MEQTKVKKRVAIFPAGSEIGLEILNAMRYSTFFEPVGFSSVPCHGAFVYREYYEGLPFYTDAQFITALNEWIASYKIDFIYPAYDDIQLFLTEHQEEIACPIVTSEKNTVDICRSKEKTYEYLLQFAEGKELVPKTYHSMENVTGYPVFIKPDVGQGSQGAQLIHTKEELQYALQKDKKKVICEYLPGEEYTVDCFTSRKGELLSCKMRNRKRIRNGISVSSEVLKLPETVERAALFINSKFTFQGAWFFQIKKDVNGNYRLLEIAPRIAGTMGLTRNTGINYPVLTLFTLMGTEVSVIANDYPLKVDRALISRYQMGIEYERVYVDLDDTLIVDGKVNTVLMRFLYQCVNQEKEIYLLTRHIREVKQTLSEHHIAESLFQQIIHIQDDTAKSNYIKEKSIFIDDSFRERKDVREHCSIPVFDCSEVESLIDWRIG